MPKAVLTYFLCLLQNRGNVHNLQPNSIAYIRRTGFENFGVKQMNADKCLTNRNRHYKNKHFTAVTCVIALSHQKQPDKEEKARPPLFYFQTIENYGDIQEKFL